MNVLFSVALVLHLLVAVAIIGLVLLQHGKGADMGAAFGSGTSGSLFGSSGSANFMSRTTGVLAAAFFVTSLTLAYVAAAKPKTSGGVMQGVVESQPSSIPSPDGVVTMPSRSNDVSGADAESKSKDIPR